MKLGYDLFRRLEDGNPLWITKVETLAEAKEKIDSYNRAFPGSYFIRDAQTGAILNESKTLRPNATA